MQKSECPSASPVGEADEAGRTDGERRKANGNGGSPSPLPSPTAGRGVRGGGSPSPLPSPTAGRGGRGGRGFQVAHPRGRQGGWFVPRIRYAHPGALDGGKGVKGRGSEGR